MAVLINQSANEHPLKLDKPVQQKYEFFSKSSIRICEFAFGQESNLKVVSKQKSGSRKSFVMVFQQYSGPCTLTTTRDLPHSQSRKRRRRRKSGVRLLRITCCYLKFTALTTVMRIQNRLNSQSNRFSFLGSFFMFHFWPYLDGQRI